MTKLTIVYAGSNPETRLLHAASAQEWAIFVPESLADALAMTVFYVPHAVVIDGREDWLTEYAMHLASATGPGPRNHELVVLIGGKPEEAVKFPSFITVWTTAADITGEALADLLEQANAAERLRITAEVA